MTHHLYLNADHLFLAYIKNRLDDPPMDKLAIRQVSAVSILACAAALEAFVNSQFVSRQLLAHYDELRLQSKIETLAELNRSSIDWGQRPWQSVSALISARNWLTHFKQPMIGLMDSRATCWIVDSHNRRPRIDPQSELTIETVRRYYDDVRQACIQLHSPDGENDFDRTVFLDEDYEPFIFG